jgi:hypothetical protein
MGLRVDSTDNQGVHTMFYVFNSFNMTIEETATTEEEASGVADKLNREYQKRGYTPVFDFVHKDFWAEVQSWQ